MKIKLKEIVGQYLNSAEQSSHEFLRLWNIAVKGMKYEFNLDVSGSLKTVLLDVNPNKTVLLPCDYITYSKIGVLNNMGEVVTYKRNEYLARINPTKENRLEGTPQVPNGLSPYLFSPYYPDYYFNFFDGGSSYHLYGADSGTPTFGEYNVDEDAGIIYLGLNNTYQSQIVLEYLSDGFSENINDYELDVRASEAMIAYIRWNDAKDNRKKFGFNEVRGLKSEYYREKRLAKTRINKFVLNELEDVSRRANKLVAKA